MRNKERYTRFDNFGKYYLETPLNHDNEVKRRKFEGDNQHPVSNPHPLSDALGFILDRPPFRSRNISPRLNAKYHKK